MVQLPPVSSHREQGTTLLQPPSTQDGRETFYMKPLSEIINASCSGRSTWRPEVPPSLTEFFAPEEDDIGREVQ